jgi:branched-chain amino acid transport system ATP-binding protein
MSIEISDVTAGYVPGVSILNGVSVDVEDGQILTILGPNGSGKSTLLKSAMGFVAVWEGAVHVDGKDVTRVPAHQRAVGHGVGFVPQLANVFGPLTIRENLEIGGARLSRGERRSRAAELLELYPRLGERAKSRADSLSGGERQMLAISRALMTRPRYLLLDEPSAGLSPAMLEQLFATLVDIREREGVTILVVEQNAAQSLAVSDHGLVLVLGDVALAGPASGLLADPRVSELYLGGAPRPAEAAATTQPA